MSDTYAVVENGMVTNIIVWDGGDEWSPESGKAVKVKKECGIGWEYDGKSFSPPHSDKTGIGANTKKITS